MTRLDRKVANATTLTYRGHHILTDTEAVKFVRAELLALRREVRSLQTDYQEMAHDVVKRGSIPLEWDAMIRACNDILALIEERLR